METFIIVSMMFLFGAVGLTLGALLMNVLKRG
jgi:hypothetical protein